MSNYQHIDLTSRRLGLKNYIDGIIQGNRPILSKALTLIESTKEEDEILAEKLLTSLLPHAKQSFRIGITGAPGVGKSTFIEAIGQHIINASKKIAVLTIDPSSSQTGGSILGDKTRMELIARHSKVFIRPSPSRASLGGVSDKTQEAITLCEAAGYDIIIVETVGVGQSEVNIRDMVDCLILLLVGGLGDELQGIKKGVIEVSDGIVVTKTDGDGLSKAKETMSNYQSALNLLTCQQSGWSPKVITASAVSKMGISNAWQMIEDYRAFTMLNGFFNKQREHQQQMWFKRSIEKGLYRKIQTLPKINDYMVALEKAVKDGEKTPTRATQELIRTLAKTMEQGIKE